MWKGREKGNIWECRKRSGRKREDEMGKRGIFNKVVERKRTGRGREEYHG
jgi:hypothetical protein